MGIYGLEEIAMDHDKFTSTTKSYMRSGKNTYTSIELDSVRRNAYFYLGATWRPKLVAD